MPIYSKYLLAVLIGLAVIPAHSAPKGNESSLKVSVDSRSNYVILAEETPLIQYAAKDFQKHLQQSTGADFPILKVTEVPEGAPRIVIGSSDFAKNFLPNVDHTELKVNEGTVLTSGEDIYLMGGDEAGACMAVYSFLEEELGVRWFTVYGDNNIPEHRSLTLPPTKRKVTTPFRYRELYVDIYQQRDRLQEFAFRHQLNRFPYKGELESANQLPRIGPQHHSFFYFIAPGPEHDNPDWATLSKPAKAGFFATNPEYFSLSTEGTRVDNLQLCFSNPNLRKEFTRQVYDLIKREKREEGIISVSALDVPGRFCNCPDCQQIERDLGTPAGPLFDYLIELCNQIEKDYPKIRISTLAYRKDQSEIPPSNLETLPKNLVIIFAPIDADFSKSLSHKDNGATTKNLRRWSELVENLWIWYYPEPYCSPNPSFGNLERIRDDFRLFAEVGVNGFFVEHSSSSAIGLNLAELKTYLLVRALKNPQLDLETEVTAFTDYYYGAAAPTMREWLQELEVIRKKHSSFMQWNPSPNHYPQISSADLLRWNDRFDAMEEKLQSQPRELDHVRNARLSLDFMLLREWQQVVKDLPTPELSPDLIRNRLMGTFETMANNRFHSSPSAQKYWKTRFNRELGHLYLMATVIVKPLPEKLAGISTERVKRAFPTASTPYASNVNDEDAACGIALSSPWKGKMEFGVYSPFGKERLLSKNIEDQEIVENKYQLYLIGRSRVTANCFAWTPSSWAIQIPIEQFYDPGNPNKEWDIYASLKFLPATADGPQTVRCDQIVLVEPSQK